MERKGRNIYYLKDHPETREALLERTFHEHGIALRRFLKARLVKEEDREDVLQDLFLRLARVEGLAQRLAEQSGSTRAYLFSIVSNLIVDRQRKAASRREDQHLAYEEEFASTDHPTPEMVVATEQQLDRMMGALKSMPEKCRQAFVLNRFKYKSYPEVAEEMGISVASVQRYIATALASLREGMK